MCNITSECSVTRAIMTIKEQLTKHASLAGWIKWWSADGRNSHPGDTHAYFREYASTPKSVR